MASQNRLHGMQKIYRATNPSSHMFKYITEFLSLLTKQQRIRLIKIQFLIIFSSLLETASVLAIGPFMTFVSSHDSIFSTDFSSAIASFFGIQTASSFLILIGCIVLSLMIISALFSIVTTWRLAIFGGDVGADLSNKMFVYFIGQPLTFHMKTNSSEIASKLIIECNRITHSVILQLLQLNAKLVLITMMILTILFTVPVIAILATIFFITSYVILYSFASNRLNRNGRATSLESQRRMKTINESFGGITEVLLYGLHERFSKRFGDATVNYYKAWSSTQVLSLLPRYAMELAAYGTMISAILFLLFSYENDLAQVLPIISVFGLASIKMLPAFQQVYFSLSTMKSNINAFLVVRNELMNIRDNETQEQSSKKSFEVMPISFNDSIEFKNISFKYDAESKNVLNNISLIFKSKKSTGIVGASGSGKSTAINILTGLLPPSGGELLIDGRNLNISDLRSWQSKIGYVSQNIFLIDGSIKENIAFGKTQEDIDESKLIQAIKMAQLEEVVSDLSHGVDTGVGERGVQLSGGQLQRVGIARALYNDPEIIIFDEATSNLDRISEKAIMQTIVTLAKSKTIIMIAHRLSTVKECDNIFLFSDGKIEDSGNYDHLIKTSSTFADMS